MTAANLAMMVPLLLAGCAGCGCVVVVSAAGDPVDDAPAGVFGGGGGGDSGFNDDGGGGDDRKTLTVSSAVKSCLAGVDPFLPCINERAMAALERTESADALLLDPGLEIARQPGDETPAPRGVYSFGDNPYNVGAVIEAASSLLSRRTFIWDLSILYPGLQMRIGPTYNGKGLIDFNVDRRHTFNERSLNYGHMIFKRSFLANVLATQITIASVIPIVFTAIYFLTKNAFLLSKVALVITSVVGYGSLFLQHSSKPIINSHHPFGGHNPTGAAAGFYPIGGHYPINGHHPISGYHHPTSGHHHNAFVGDIRGDKFYNNFDGFQKISSSKSPTASLFRGVNYFPQEEHATSDVAYKDLDLDLNDRSKKEAE
ncbi:Protein of unknown function DUF1676 [Cinara cedri]|uniref:Uncharacterized protein n=1 Tax=Cinara cedri TaxID=506608 RepID=A0A5E4MSU6_9HEMI|nr:Protein of unknown function DUF1676 [Cinara cedri]